MSAEIPHPYPPPLDPWALSRELVPPAHASPGWLAYVRACLVPMCRTSMEVAEVTRQIVGPEQATGDVLDAIGSWVGVRRGGLSEHEYRRLVLGGLAARQAQVAWTRSRALAMWRDLTGDRQATVRTLGPGAVTMTAGVLWAPSDAYIAAAGRALAGAIPHGIQYEARWVPDGALILDGAPPLNVGVLCWSANGTGGVT